MKVLKKGNTEIGAFESPDRRKPLLGIRIGNEVIGYGSFRSKESADDFMEELADFVGAEPEEPEKECFVIKSLLDSKFQKNISYKKLNLFQIRDGFIIQPKSI